MLKPRSSRTLGSVSKGENETKRGKPGYSSAPGFRNLDFYLPFSGKEFFNGRCRPIDLVLNERT